MAKFEKTLTVDFEKFSETIETEILKANISSSKGDECCFFTADSKILVRVYERYSIWGKGRVSLTLTLVENDGKINLCAITAAGSRGRLFKVNSWSEKRYLKRFIKILDSIVC